MAGQPSLDSMTVGCHAQYLNLAIWPGHVAGPSCNDNSQRGLQSPCVGSSYARKQRQQDENTGMLLVSRIFRSSGRLKIFSVRLGFVSGVHLAKFLLPSLHRGCHDVFHGLAVFSLVCRANAPLYFSWIFRVVPVCGRTWKLEGVGRAAGCAVPLHTDG